MSSSSVSLDSVTCVGMEYVKGYNKYYGGDSSSETKWLSSPGAAFTTSQDIIVDGGYSGDVREIARATRSPARQTSVPRTFISPAGQYRGTCERPNKATTPSNAKSSQAIRSRRVWDSKVTCALGSTCSGFTSDAADLNKIKRPPKLATLMSTVSFASGSCPTYV